MVGNVNFYVPEGGMDIDILVENMGRICYGYRMTEDRKGIKEFVKIGVYLDKDKEDIHNYKQQTGYEVYTLPMKDLSGLKYKPISDYRSVHRPTFFKGCFKAEPDVDTFLNTENWTKGNVWINGFNLGRYWSIGPQLTLYVPGELLKEENTIEILEIYDAPDDLSVCFDYEAKLDSLEYNVDYNGNKMTEKLEDSARS